MSSSESEDYEDSDFELMQSDCEPSDSSDSDISDDISDDECEGMELPGGWRRVPDIFSDRRPNSLPDLTRDYSDINPNVQFSAKIHPTR